MPKPKDYLDDNSPLIFEPYMLEEGMGQTEGRDISRKAVIDFLQPLFPDNKITTRNYGSYLNRYLENLSSQQE